MFAACVALEGLRAPDVENLRHFGVDAALAAPSPLAPRADSAAIVGALTGHLEAVASARAAGWTVYAAFGVHGAQAPVRSAERAWVRLREAVEHGELVALGPLGVGGARSLERGAVVRQLELAALLGCPVLLLPRHGKRHVDTPRLLDAAVRAGVSLRRCVVLGVDYASVRPVLQTGASAVVLLGLGARADALALALAADFAEELGERLSFGFAPLPGMPDCTAFARAQEWSRADHAAGELLQVALARRPTWLTQGVGSEGVARLADGAGGGAQQS